LNDVETSEAEKIKDLKQEHAKKSGFKVPFDFPFVGKPGAASELNETKWADPKHNCKLIQSIDKRTFQVNGKVLLKKNLLLLVDLKEVNFKTMESKLHENLYFAGEIVNIDAITGGFNFQNAWTSGFILANSI
jgi:predicted flavoprotein YhiN